MESQKRKCESGCYEDMNTFACVLTSDFHRKASNRSSCQLMTACTERVHTKTDRNLLSAMKQSVIGIDSEKAKGQKCKLFVLGDSFWESVGEGFGSTAVSGGQAYLPLVLKDGVNEDGTVFLP